LPKSAEKIVFNISGPYAVGKDTILNELASTFRSRVYRVHTITTRPVSKVDDPTYEQVTAREFEKRISSGRWIANYQLSGQTAYGTSVDEIENAAEQGFICIHSVYAGKDGAGRLREFFGRRALSIGLLPTHGSAPEQLEELRNRLLLRSRDAPSAIEARLKHQLHPLEYVLDNPSVMTDDEPMKVFDHVITNENLEVTKRNVLRLFEQVFLGELVEEIQ
jgi:guanylate kinase